MGVILNADVFTVMIIIIQRKPEVCVMQSLSFNFRMSKVQNRTRFAKHVQDPSHSVASSTPSARPGVWYVEL